MLFRSVLFNYKILVVNRGCICSLLSGTKLSLKICRKL